MKNICTEKWSIKNSQNQGWTLLLAITKRMLDNGAILKHIMKPTANNLDSTKQTEFYFWWSFWVLSSS